MNKVQSYLGLCMRAGKLVSGEEIVLKAVRSREAQLVIVAIDASDNTIKKFLDKCSHYNVPIVQCLTREQLGNSIGRNQRVVAAVNDHGFAGLIRRALEKQTEV